VIKTVPFDIIFSFIIGGALALLFEKELKSTRSGFFNPYFISGLIFEGLFYLPLGIFLYYFYPAWSWMYFFNPGSVSLLKLALLGIIMTFSYILSYGLGFQLIRFLNQRGSKRGAKIILGSAVGILAFFSLFTLNRLFYVGDYQVWREGLAVLFFRHRLFWINLLMAVIGFGALFRLIQQLKKLSF